MRRRFPLAVALVFTACSPSRAEETYSEVRNLPARFSLDCAPPKLTGRQLPRGTEGGFNVAVDMRSRMFSVPWLRGKSPIKQIGKTEILFLDWYVERGLDNNSMEAKLRYIVPSGQLIYRSVASARLPLDYSFTASCKVVRNA